jgi:xylan 1,4-beta-xylosidase
MQAARVIPCFLSNHRRARRISMLCRLRRNRAFPETPLKFKMKRWLIICLLILACQPLVFADGNVTGTQGAPPVARVITGDLKAIKGPRSMAWQDCVGAGRVAEGLRAEWRQQLAECHREIGFKYLRMHGLLQDELGVYSEDADGQPHYNWQYIDDVYDYLLSIGVKPFVEFGFMPSALASGNAKIFWWQGMVTPPKDYAKWDALITALVQHWTDRYGEAEVKTWRFEIWNEPNYPGFWHPPQGATARDEYFKLYEHTSRAVQSVSTNYLVGGPAGAGPVWTAELIDLCVQKNIPLDFISYHAYGLGGGPSGLDEYGNTKLYLSPDIRAVADTVNSQRPIIEKSARPGLPIYITEWSASYSPRDPVHDSYFEAAYMLEQLRHTESVSAMSYWTFTDIFEENGPAPRAFHGGFGLINFEGIRKPAFWAYQYLARLGETELQNDDDASWVCTDKSGGVQVLLWDITHPTDGKTSDQDFFFHEHPARDKGNMTVKLKNLAPGKYQLIICKTGFQANDPYSRYLELGKPTNLSREAVAELKNLASDKPVSTSEVTIGAPGIFEQTLPLREDDVYLVTLKPE